MLARMTALGEFEALVLMAVLHLGNEAYPPAVRLEIERRARRKVARGAVYVTLERLEAKRLIGSQTTAPDDFAASRPRRHYKVSPRGLRALRHALAGVERMRVGLEPILNDQ
jgi:PadR family transcriptional regulator, regulatory protein PadR